MKRLVPMEEINEFYDALCDRLEPAINYSPDMVMFSLTSIIAQMCLDRNMDLDSAEKMMSSSFKQCFCRLANDSSYINSMN
jgi:hypothetical protein